MQEYVEEQIPEGELMELEFAEFTWLFKPLSLECGL